MTNVDWSEINKFSNMAMDWWDPNGPMKPLHQLNPVRLSYVAQHTMLQGARILDLGCGGGILTEALAKAGAILTGVDLSDEAIQIAKVHAQGEGLSIRYLTQAVEDLAISEAYQKDSEDSGFDVITCMEMIEHVPSPEAILASITPLLRPNGVLFMSTLNRHPRAFIEAIVGAEYVLNMIPRGTHEYKKFIRPSELERMARAAHLKMVDIKGISYAPFRKTFSLTNSLSVNYVACFKKIDED